MDLHTPHDLARGAPLSQRKQVRARQAEPSLECVEVELRDQDAVAVSDDLAARDLRLVRDDRLELLLADPVGDELRRLLALLRRLDCSSSWAHTQPCA